MKQYIITQEQLDAIRHYTDMFELNSGKIKFLCESEKDDIVYGFELGQMYSHLRECYLDMCDIQTRIKEQKGH